MSLTSLVIRQSFIMLLLICIGAVSFKTKIISKNGSREISKLVLDIVNPVIILSSFQKEFNPQLMKNLGLSAILSVISFIITIIVASLAVRSKKDSSDIDIERFSAIYSNCAFMGIPLINALFSTEGVFYLTSFIAVFNLLVWTHGIMTISGNKNLDSFKKAIVSPSFIAIFLGLALFLFQIKLPDIIGSTIKYIGDMNTPLAMITAGINICQTNILKAFQKPRIYFIAFLRLIFIPLLLILIMKPLHLYETVTLTVIIAAAAPSATMCTLLSMQYNKNSLYASEIFAVTTILSTLTLPLIIIAFQSIPI